MFNALKSCLTASTILIMAAPVNAEQFSFCWTGGAGYSLIGTMDIPDDKLTGALITEDDVTAFKIVGYLNGERLGGWSMASRRPNATWHLRFDPKSQTFLTGGSFSTVNSQGWNANGTASNCGNPGFGFNSGNYAQDVCVDGVYMRDSSIAPDTPLTATTGAIDPTCGQTIPLSKAK